MVWPDRALSVSRVLGYEHSVKTSLRTPLTVLQRNSPRSSSLVALLAVLAPLWHHAHSVHRMVLMGGKGPGHPMRIQELGWLKAAGSRLDARLRSALPNNRLVRDRRLMLKHGMRVPDLRRGVIRDSGEARHQRAGGKMRRKMLVGESVHRLHGSHCAAAVGGHSRPRVAADVFQAGHGLCGRGRAGVHTGLALR